MLTIYGVGITRTNCTLPGNAKDFIPDTLKPDDLIITFAKEGITMKATVVGDCDLHSFDQHGKPQTLWLKDILYVPGAANNRLSMTSLGEYGYHYIHSSNNLAYRPGLHLPWFRNQGDPYYSLSTGYRILQLVTICTT